jgi:hypothetical protein
MAKVVVVTPLVIVIDNCHTIGQLELGYTIGIDHQQQNEDCVVDNYPCP